VSRRLRSALPRLVDRLTSRRAGRFVGVREAGTGLVDGDRIRHSISAGALSSMTFAPGRLLPEARQFVARVKAIERRLAEPDSLVA
jgi:hypothetical protein